MSLHGVSQENIQVVPLVVLTVKIIERKSRAIDLAKKLNTDSQNIAGAWPLNLDFPSFALIGPRIISEIDSSLKNLDLELTREQVKLVEFKRLRNLSITFTFM